MNAIQGDGATLRQHWQMYERQTGKTPDALNVAPPPDAIAHVWQWFLSLHRRRRVGMNGPEPLDDLAIEAWAKLRRIRLLPVEVEALAALDEAYFVSVADARKGNKE